VSAKNKCTQRAIIVLRDTADGGVTADLSFEPSIKGRTVESPCVNAALRLANIILTAKDQLVAALPKSAGDTPAATAAIQGAAS